METIYDVLRRLCIGPGQNQAEIDEMQQIINDWEASQQPPAGS
jgi:hypothetical protein